MTFIYLDHNATTPLDPEVADAMHACQVRALGNPASQHQAGRRARRLLEDARDGIAALLGAETMGRQADRVVFTSGGTEANNLALRGIARRHAAISAIEHPSLLNTAATLRQLGWEIAVLGVERSGRLNISQLEQHVRRGCELVSVMLANHETGVLQPLDDVVRFCRELGVAVHTDAVQAAGKIHVHFRELGVDAMSVSAHKFHGPVGIGALVLRAEVACQPLLYGGFQQLGSRPGTESVVLAVGMHEALKRWHAEAARREAAMRQLRDTLETRLSAALPAVRIHGRDAPRVPHTSSLSFPGIDRQAMVMALDLAGVGCSTGSACASGSSEPSPVLRAMGVPGEEMESAVRISLGALTTAGEVALAADRIISVYNDLIRR